MHKTSNPQELVQDLLLWRDTSIHVELERISKKHQIPLDALAILIHWQKEQSGKLRTRDRNSTFDDVFTNTRYWNTQNKK